MSRLTAVLPKKAVIGMLHLLPLPGSPRAGAGALEAAKALAVADAEALVAGGCHALMMENFGDSPFFPDRVPAHVVAAMTAVACEISCRRSAARRRS